MKKGKGNAAVIICMVVAIVSLIAGLTIIFAEKSNKNSLDSSEKNIAVEVIAQGYEDKIYRVTTQKQYLGEVLIEEKIAEGENGQYGLYIKTAGGIKADEGKSEWWCITKNGEAVSTGADAVKIADGDKFELTLKTGY